MQNVSLGDRLDEISTLPSEEKNWRLLAQITSSKLIFRKTGADSEGCRGFDRTPFALKFLYHGIFFFIWNSVLTLNIHTADFLPYTSLQQIHLSAVEYV